MVAPVMSLAYCQSKNSHTLGIACQDGTIKLVTWDRRSEASGSDTGTEHEETADKGDSKQNETSSRFQNITSRQVIVDGPLLGLQLELQPTDDSIRVIVGSLCGYVCQLVQGIADDKSTTNDDSETCQSKINLQEPAMIADGFWNPSIDMEDPVLAVHAHQTYVFVGTLSGRCLVYTKNRSVGNSGSLYYLSWECRLPYSIHGFEVLQSDHDSMWYLVVVTRRSAHVFRASQDPVDEVELKASLSALVAKNLLQGLLRSFDRPEEKTAPEATSPAPNEATEPEEPTLQPTTGDEEIL